MVMLKDTRTNSYNLTKTIVLVLTSQMEYMNWLRKSTVSCWRRLCLLSNARLDKSFWAEAIVYASHLINGLSSTAIGGKAPLEVWSGKATQEYDLLRVFESLTYFSAKDRKVNHQSEKFMFLGVKRNMKDYRL